jgi:hypothetical protein
VSVRSSVRPSVCPCISAHSSVRPAIHARAGSSGALTSDCPSCVRLCLPTLQVEIKLRLPDSAAHAKVMEVLQPSLQALHSQVRACMHQSLCTLKCVHACAKYLCRHVRVPASPSGVNAYSLLEVVHLHSSLLRAHHEL